MYEGFSCDKGALYAPKATRDGIVIEPNLGTATTDKTIAILVRHEVGGSQGPVELDNQPDRGSSDSNVIYENEAFRLYRYTDVKSKYMILSTLIFTDHLYFHPAATTSPMSM